MEKTYTIKQAKEYLNQVIDEETKILWKKLKEKRVDFNSKTIAYV